MQIYLDVSKLNKNEFYNFQSTKGRGDISKLKINKKNIFFIDESYNSNPLSLNSALENFDKIEIEKNRKHIILGDMLELGRHSKKLHSSMSKKINQIFVNKVHVIGRDIKETFKVPAFINGAIHAFESFFLRHSDKRLRVLDGDFMF